MLADGKEPRDIAVSLPPGLTGDPSAVPQCTRQELERVQLPGRQPGRPAVGRRIASSVQQSSSACSTWCLRRECRPSSAPRSSGSTAIWMRVSARAAITGSRPTPTTSCRSKSRHLDGDAVGRSRRPQPQAVAHGGQSGCTERIRTNEKTSTECKPPGGSPKAFLTLPVACEGSQAFSIFTSSWQDPSLDLAGELPVA